LPILEKFALSNSKTAMELPPRSMTRLGGLVSGLMQGISKKNNKPYAMLTIEDLEGTFQVLAMNENYDKYRQHFEMNKPLLIIGEVNNQEDRPKIFPTEIMPLEDAPKKFTKQVHLRLQATNFTPERLGEVQGLVSSFPGRVPLFIQIKMPTGEAVFIEAHERFNVTPTRELAAEANRLFGDQTYYATVDTSLPEPKRKAWEKKTTNGDED
jgi:DNA polymerase-3 subunit alpha